VNKFGWSLSVFSVMCLVFAILAIHKNGISFYHYFSIPSICFLFLLGLFIILSEKRKRKHK